MTHSIAFVLADLGGGGAQRVAVNMANYWAEQGKSIHLITLDDASRDAYELHRDIKRVGLGATGHSNGLLSGVKANFRRLACLRRALKNSQSDRVISFIAPTNVLTIIASIGLSSKVVISERNDPGKQSFGKLWDLLRKVTYPKAARVTANSYGAIRTLESYVSHKKLNYIPNPITEFNEGEARELLSGPAILAVGRFHHQKAYDILIPAFAKFHKRFPDWTLWILGSGGLENDIKGWIQEHNIEDAVKLFGHVKNPRPFYEAASIFSLLSRHEGMPNALLEAMSFGLVPVISDCLPGPLEVVENRVNGLVTKFGDEDGIVEAFFELASNEEVQKKYSFEAIKIKQERSITSISKTWEAVLEI